jgi:hypothetical protein
VIRAALIAAVASLAMAAPASAAVLVEALPRHPVCGDPIRPGIWAQSWTTASRTVRMTAIDRRTGRVWWRRTAVASKHRWRHWTLPSGMNGSCRAAVFVYRGAHWTARFRVTFRREHA